MRPFARAKPIATIKMMFVRCSAPESMAFVMVPLGMESTTTQSRPRYSKLWAMTKFSLLASLELVLISALLNKVPVTEDQSDAVAFASSTTSFAVCTTQPSSHSVAMMTSSMDAELS